MCRGTSVSRWRTWRHLLTLLMVTTLGLAMADPVQALGWPSRLQTGTRETNIRSKPFALQEVPAPEPVQQLLEALEERQPQLTILNPANEALLPEGPWNLQLSIDDWPLVDAGSLGLGPHLVVQIDGGPPQPLTRTELTMPELSPGSHRITVYAARPWGEAVKSPGAFRQIRLHRIAPNPISLPSRDQAQLIPVSPQPEAQNEPILLDWLLLDAPLQHLRGGDNSWRLRVSVNGDSVLIDHQTPLWLKGLRPGSNALQLDLVDGRGEPLNPPFNSLVAEVRFEATAASPRWRGPRLSATELAQMIGEAPPPLQASSIVAEANDQDVPEPMAPITQLEPDPNPSPSNKSPLPQTTLAKQPGQSDHAEETSTPTTGCTEMVPEQLATSEPSSLPPSGLDSPEKKPDHGAIERDSMAPKARILPPPSVPEEGDPRLEPDPLTDLHPLENIPVSNNPEPMDWLQAWQR